METKNLVDATSWNERLASLLGQERRVQVEFLVALAAFAERRLYLDIGYASLWDYCLRGLHLREGATFLRTRAVALLRRFPALVEPLRDGRLCLTTLVELEPVLTEANAGELLERAAYRTKAEVKRLVASLSPKPAPADSLRRAPARVAAPGAASTVASPLDPAALVLAAPAPRAAPAADSLRREEPVARRGVLHLRGSRRHALRLAPPSRAGPRRAGRARRAVDGG